MHRRLLLATSSCFLAPLIAHAQPVTGPYVSLGGGVNIVDPVNYSFTQGTNSGKTSLSTGYAGVGAVGYGFGDGFRVEIGGDFARNQLHKTTRSDGGQFQVSGAQEKYGPMVNVYYDIKLGLPVFPYVGAGAGYQWVKLDPDLANPAGQRTGGTAGSFAYDVVAGLSYPLPFVPGLAVTAEYRFMQLTGNRDYSFSSPARLPVPSGTLHEYGQESSSSFLLGLRYQIFNPPPALPAAAPVQEAGTVFPSRIYLVFFDWDKYNLSQRATQLVARAATDSSNNKTTIINVSGYTDTSGTASYNMGLSERRAKAVAAQLVTDGVPKSEISIHAYGETHPLVPTGPGVREPQNRRVEIHLEPGCSREDCGS